jgi:hypothetical protein
VRTEEPSQHKFGGRSKVLLTWNSGTHQFNPVRREILVNGVPTGNALSTVPAGTNPRPPVQSACVRQLDPSTSYEFSVRAIDPSGNVRADQPDPPQRLRRRLLVLPGGALDHLDRVDRRPQPASGIEYEVRVNGTIIDVIPGGTQTVSYTEVLGANIVKIVAVDQAGNASAPSNPITVITNWAPGGCGL